MPISLYHNSGPTKKANKAKVQDCQMGPHLPHGNQASTASTTATKDRGTSRGPLQPGRRRGGPGDPDARQEARSPPGSSLHTSKEDKLASSCWKLLEDFGAKKTKVPSGDMVRKGVSLCPPTLQKVGDRA